MIPQDQFIAVSRKVFGTILNIACQIVGIGHGAGAGVLDQALHASAHDLIDLIDSAADDIIAPALAASRIDKEIYLASEISRDHFLQIRSSHAASGLQIRAAEVDHDRDGIFSVALDPGKLLSRSGSDRRIEPCLGRVLSAPS